MPDWTGIRTATPDVLGEEINSVEFFVGEAEIAACGAGLKVTEGLEERPWLWTRRLEGRCSRDEALDRVEKDELFAIVKSLRPGVGKSERKALEGAQTAELFERVVELPIILFLRGGWWAETAGIHRMVKETREWAQKSGWIPCLWWRPDIKMISPGSVSTSVLLTRKIAEPVEEMLITSIEWLPRSNNGSSSLCKPKPTRGGYLLMRIDGKPSDRTDGRCPTASWIRGTQEKWRWEGLEPVEPE
jgi:hypothetical protein